MVSRLASAICEAIVQTVPCMKVASRANTIRLRDSPTHIRAIKKSGRATETSASATRNCKPTQYPKMATKRALRCRWDRKVKNANELPMSRNCRNAMKEARRKTMRP
jgi:hypothetical protein